MGHGSVGRNTRRLRAERLKASASRQRPAAPRPAAATTSQLAPTTTPLAAATSQEKSTPATPGGGTLTFMKKNRAFLHKNIGQVFTPPHIANIILDFAGYVGESILRKHVIDNSCGEGAFLVLAVERYCKAFLNVSRDLHALKRELETYVHGIEIDEPTFRNCLLRLDETARAFGMNGIAWDIRLGNTLHINHYDGQMDFVVGNPPYVRVHNLRDNYDDVKQYAFADRGMTDLYLVFIEIGLRMLNPQGRMAFITPSSWLSSKAGASLRTSLLQTRQLKAVIDLEHYQAFDSVTTYTLVSLYEKTSHDEKLRYHVYDSHSEKVRFIAELTPADYAIYDGFYLGTPRQLATLRRIKGGTCSAIVKAKNGFATLADKVFIGQVPSSPITIDMLKASTGTWQKGLFPYTPKGLPLSWDDITAMPEVAAYLLQRQNELLKGGPERPDWFLYGRTQALRDVCKPKVAVNSLVRETGNLKIEAVAPGQGVYSGFYLLGNVSEQDVKSILVTDDFIAYLAMLKNYKSGGYYTYSSKDLEQYVNYQLSLAHDSHNKRSVLAMCGTFF